MKFILLQISMLFIWPLAAQDNFSRPLNAYFSRLESKGKAMGNITIWQKGEVVYKNSIGFASLEPGQKADDLTLYHIGSVSKTFTAVVILQMVEEGKLSLDMKLSHFYPKWPHAEKITIEDLLRHRSGIHNFGEDRSVKYRDIDPQTNEEIVSVFQNAESAFLPGSRSEYNNANYVVLSLIAETVDAKSFAEIIEQRIVKPQNLYRTGDGGKIDPTGNEAYSYFRKRGQWVENPQGDLTSLKGAGALVSTPSELCKFYAALFEGEFFSGELLQEMISIEDGYGIGIFRYPFYSRTCYGHAGSIGAFESFAAYFPDEDVAIAICLNAGGEEMNAILKEVLEIWFEVN